MIPMFRFSDEQQSIATLVTMMSILFFLFLLLSSSFLSFHLFISLLLPSSLFALNLLFSLFVSPPLLSFDLLLPLVLAVQLSLPLADTVVPIAVPVLGLPNRLPDLLDGVKPLDLVGHASDDELLAKQSPLTARALTHGVGEVFVVPLAVRLLDGCEVSPIPVEAHEAADEEFAA